MKVISLYNNKGGVAKTTTVLNVSYVLAHKGKRVLVADFDGQCNSTDFLMEPVNKINGAEAALISADAQPDSAVYHSRYNNIDILAATNKMNSVSGTLENISREQRIENAEKIIDQFSNDYDYILIDLPPALNTLTSTILAVSDIVFVPIELSAFSIQGVANVTDIISRSGVYFGGVFVTKFDKSNSADVQMLELLKNSLGTKVLSSVIPYSNVIKNSISMRKVAAEYRWGKAASAYLKLTNEIERICKGGEE